jgi:hypothetical protein
MDELKYAKKVGWGGGGRFYHLVVQPEDRKKPERPACGVKVAIAGRSETASGPRCARCAAYAQKRRWK